MVPAKNYACISPCFPPRFGSIYRPVPAPENRNPVSESGRRFGRDGRGRYSLIGGGALSSRRNDETTLGSGAGNPSHAFAYVGVPTDMFSKTISLNLDEQLAAALAAKKIETGVPTQEFIRRAIRMALFTEGRQPKIETRTGA